MCSFWYEGNNPKASQIQFLYPHIFRRGDITSSFPILSNAAVNPFPNFAFTQEAVEGCSGMLLLLLSGMSELLKQDKKKILP